MKKYIALALICLLLTGCAAFPSETTVPTEAPVSLTLYLPDENVEHLVPTEVTVPEISYRILLEQLTQAGSLTEEVQINAFASETSEMAIDFNAAFGQLVSSMGTAGEYAILGSVVNTFLNAYGGKTILLTVNGKPLETGHNIYDTPLSFFE